MSFGIEFPFGIGIGFLLTEIRPSQGQVCIIIEIYNRIVLNILGISYVLFNSLPSTIDDRARYTLEEISANWKVPSRILYRFIPRSEFFFLSDLS